MSSYGSISNMKKLVDSNCVAKCNHSTKCKYITRFRELLRKINEPSLSDILLSNIEPQKWKDNLIGQLDGVMGRIIGCLFLHDFTRMPPEAYTLKEIIRCIGDVGYYILKNLTAKYEEDGAFVRDIIGMVKVLKRDYNVPRNRIINAIKMLVAWGFIESKWYYYPNRFVSTGKGDFQVRARKYYITDNGRKLFEKMDRNMKKVVKRAEERGSSICSEEFLEAWRRLNEQQRNRGNTDQN